MPVFPLSLPPLAGAAAFSGQAASSTIRTRMDAGPAKVRRRSTAAPATRRMGHPRYTTAELQTFLAFFRDTLAGGALSFDMDDLVTGATATCRFTAPPSYSAAAPGRWSVSAELEVLPSSTPQVVAVGTIPDQSMTVGEAIAPLDLSAYFAEV